MQCKPRGARCACLRARAHGSHGLARAPHVHTDTLTATTPPRVPLTDGSQSLTLTLTGGSATSRTIAVWAPRGSGRCHSSGAVAGGRQTRAAGSSCWGAEQIRAGQAPPLLSSLLFSSLHRQWQCSGALIKVLINKSRIRTGHPNDY